MPCGTVVGGLVRSSEWEGLRRISSGSDRASRGSVSQPRSGGDGISNAAPSR